MDENLERRRLLLAAREEGGPIEALFTDGRIAGWETVAAASFEQARYLLQMSPCDVILLDASLYRAQAPEGLSWLAQGERVPILFLADIGPEGILEALEHGAHYWLPRRLALEHPPLLAAVLGKAAQFTDLKYRVEAAGARLDDCREQVRRLVSLLWEAAPGQGSSRWFSQRYMMERLQEEVMRTQRHGGPLSVVIGELHGREPVATCDTQQLASWTFQRISQAKRLCDVAGQYGPQGFMLLLPRVTETEAEGCCRRLRTLLEHGPAAPFAPLHACFGGASLAPDVSSSRQLLRHAEERLDQARQEE
jgi:GGDEF domain-containing protein